MIKNRKYRVLVLGQNILLRDEDSGVVERVGLYPTRYVEAMNDKHAMEVAIEGVRNEIVKDIHPLNSSGDPPRLDIDEIEELERFPEAAPRGFTFFADNEEN